MKTIGIIGGMSWQSSESYYRLINTKVKQRLGGLNSAKIVLNSLNFAEIEALQVAKKWSEMAVILTTEAQKLANAGADCVVIATNTMHKVAEQVSEQCELPLLHIADATAERLKKDQINRVGLLGTKFTMEQAFYKQRLIEKHGIAVITPNQQERDCVHQVIYKELCIGVINSASKRNYVKITESLAKQGAQAVILGCTEIGLLLKQADTYVRLYDTTEIHADFAVNYALS
jgi:aspartate racemase